MNKQKGFVWIVVALVIILIIIFFWNKKAVAPTNEGEHASATAQVSETPTSTPAVTTTKPPTTPKPKTPVAATPKMTSTGAYYISYTGSGFSPSSLSIPLGKSVHFVNNSNSSMRISPIDTTNQPYASFAQSKTVGKGGYFDYTFVTRGSYGYKNLGTSIHTANITVY